MSIAGARASHWRREDRGAAFGAAVSTPGFADTSDEHQQRMLTSIPMGRYAEPEEVGWAVRFLASPEAGYITGQTLIVDGGQVLPEAPL